MRIADWDGISPSCKVQCEMPRSKKLIVVKIDDSVAECDELTHIVNHYGSSY